MDYRLGFGYDIHRLAKGRSLLLGGVNIPYEKGLLGHSDADVLLHAICDAILGAIGAPDIGEQFPDTDLQYKDCSSAQLLKKVLELAKRSGFVINNIDSVIIAQKPSLSAFKNKIRNSISALTGVSLERVNVKAKTNEGIGMIGDAEAIASYAVVSVTYGG